jgi:hypothetical protein
MIRAMAAVSLAYAAGVLTIALEGPLVVVAIFSMLYVAGLLATYDRDEA